MFKDHKDVRTCTRTGEAAWSKRAMTEIEARKQDTQLVSWCCHTCLNMVRKYQFGYEPCVVVK